MQEKETINSVSDIYGRLIRVLAWLLLFVTWAGLVAATKSFLGAAIEHGLFEPKTFLDAGFGYYGLFSFGLAALAVLLGAKRGIIRTRTFKIFKVTFLVSIFFLVPVLFSVVMYLLS